MSRHTKIQSFGLGISPPLDHTPFVCLLIVLGKNEESRAVGNGNDLVHWGLGGHASSLVNLLLLRLELPLLLFCNKGQCLVASADSHLPVFRGKYKEGALFGQGF